MEGSSFMKIIFYSIASNLRNRFFKLSVVTENEMYRAFLRKENVHKSSNIKAFKNQFIEWVRSLSCFFLKIPPVFRLVRAY